MNIRSKLFTRRVFGESALLNLPRRCEQATALENTKVMTWTTAEIEDIITKRSRLAVADACAHRPLYDNATFEEVAARCRRALDALVTWAERLERSFDRSRSVNELPTTCYTQSSISTTPTVSGRRAVQLTSQPQLRFPRLWAKRNTRFFAVGTVCFLMGAAIAFLFSSGQRLIGVVHAQSPLRQTDQQRVDAFHLWYYNNADRTWDNTRWLGVLVQKNPFDLWVYQELIIETHPDVLIEAGTFKGGSAYFFASILDFLGKGRVYTIDIEEQPNRPQHRRINYLLGSSTSEAVVQKIKNAILPGEQVMVSLDSNHSKAHVLNELKIYSDMVTLGNYLVVEDTNVNGHPVWPGFGPGPWEAVQEFLKADSRFVADKSRERFGMTFNPRGWLKRVR
jgi:cephalosporin hydroxylase